MLDATQEPLVDSSQGVLPRGGRDALRDCRTREDKLTETVELCQRVPLVRLEGGKLPQNLKHVVPLLRV